MIRFKQNLCDEKEPQTLPVSYQKLSDDELVALCQEQLPHNTGAYEEILARYESLIFNTCKSMLGSYEDAKEVSQTIFIRVFNKIDKFEGRAAFKTWLFRITYNACFTRRAKLAKTRERLNLYAEKAEDFAPQEIKETIVDFGDGPTSVILKQLSNEDSEILTLRYISELSLDEIAESMGLKLSATKMRLYRALERFKEMYISLDKSYYY